jgi:Cu/Ag efflux pump CusA
MNLTRFKVFYSVGREDERIGAAELKENKVKISLDPESQFLKNKDKAFIREVNKEVRHLARSLGHSGKYVSSVNMDTGIKVEKIS